MRLLKSVQIKDISDFIDLKLLDYSENRILSKCHDISFFVFAESITSLLSIDYDALWFARKIKEKKMISLFDISSGDDLQVYKSLLFCFSHQGSTKGIYNLLRALFGESATIEMEVSLNTINITTDLDNINFFRAFITTSYEWMSSKDMLGLTADSFKELGVTDITLFLQQFLNTGKKLTLNINNN